MAYYEDRRGSRRDRYDDRDRSRRNNRRDDYRRRDRDRYDDRGYGGRSGGYDNRRHGGGHRNDRYGGGRDRHGGGYGGGYRRGGRGRGGRGRGRGRGGFGGKNITPHHDNHSSDLIEQIRDKVGEATREVMEVNVFKDENGNLWEERLKLKTGSKFYYCQKLNQTLFDKPDNLELIDEKTELYCPHLPQTASWNVESCDTESVEVNCFEAELTTNIYRYEVLDLEERTCRGVRWKLFPRQLSREGKKTLRKLVKEKFGSNFVVCDGFIISTNQIDDLEFEISVEDGQYVVGFTNSKQVVFGNLDTSDDSQHEASMQMLSYLMDEVADKAGFKRETVGGKRRNIYWKHEGKSQNTISQRGADWSKPDLQLFRVFEAKLGISENDSTGKRGLFMNVDVSHKHLAARSLRDFIDKMAERYSGEELKEKVAKEFQRKRAIVSYSSGFVQIDHFNWDKNEKHEFTGRGGKTHSIESYLDERYGIDVEKGELCTVACRDGRGRQLNDYLPQHVYVTVSKEQTNDIDAMVKEQEAMSPSERMRVLKDFVHQFGAEQSESNCPLWYQRLHERHKSLIENEINGWNGSAKDLEEHLMAEFGVGRKEIRELLQWSKEISSQGDPTFALKINTSPTRVEGLVMPEPRLALMVYNREASENPKDFTQNWRNCKGFMNNPSRVRIGAITANRHNARDIEDYFYKYQRKRGIQDYVEYVGCEDFGSWNERDVKDALEGLGRCDLAMIVIDDGKTGSEQKSIASRVAGSLGLKTQFIRTNNIGGKPTPFFGAMDDIMAKCGAAWYVIEYGFKTLDARDIWVLGVDVYKSQSEAQMSGLNIQLCTDITIGSLGDTMNKTSYLLLPKKTISPMRPFKLALEKLLSEARDRCERQPKYILMFRGGISMAELVIFRTNEVIAFVQAISNVFPKSSRPRGTTYVVPKGSRVRFSQTRNPVCVASGITGGFYVDFYTQVNVRHRKTPRIIHYATIHDDGFMKNIIKDEPEDFLRLISGLCYLYPQSINFSNGPCSYPGPLKAAQNTSENFTQFVFKEDQSLENLGTLPNSFLNQIAELNILSHTEDVEMAEN